MAKFQIEVTDDLGVKVTAKITGTPATAILDSLTQFLATQFDVTGTPPVSVPRYTDAADLVKKQLIKLVQDISPKFPSAQTVADVVEINTKQTALDAKRKAIFDAAIAEK